MSGAPVIRCQGPTMSSREIAELTGRDHKNVLRDIRIQLLMLLCGSTMRELHGQCADLSMPLSRFVADNCTRFFELYLDGSNTSHQQNQGFTAVRDDRGYLAEVLLDKSHSYTLMTGYDVVARHKVVKRWQELEAQAAPAVPQTMAQALRLAAEQAEQLETQREQLALAAPKVEYVDRYVAANGSMGFRQVAKLLQANEHEFRAWLQDAKIMYRLSNEWTAYQNHIEAGRFVVRSGVAKANEHAFSTTKFTPKGVEWVAGLWGKHKAALALEGGAA